MGTFNSVDVNSWFRSFVSAGLANDPAWLAKSAHRTKDLLANVEELSQFRVAMDGATNSPDVPFELFIVGDGKVGKSSLINCLLGASVAAVDFLPKTWCFHRFIVSKDEGDTVKLFVQLPLLPIHKHLEQALGPKIGEQGQLGVYRRPASDVVRIHDDEETRAAECDDSGNPVYQSPIVEVESQVPSVESRFLGLRFVDTLGLNQDHQTPMQRAYLQWEYRRADAVLWVVDALRIGAKGGRENLRALGKYAKVIILVLNKIDKIPSDQRMRTIKRATEVYGRAVTRIVPLSAEAGFLAHKSGDLAALEASGTRDLLRIIDSEILRKSALIRNKQRYSAIRQIQRDVRGRVRDLRDAAHDNVCKYDETVRNIEAAIQTCLKQVSLTVKERQQGYEELIRTRTKNITLDTDSWRVQQLLQWDALQLQLQSSLKSVQSDVRDVLGGQQDAIADLQFTNAQIITPGTTKTTRTYHRHKLSLSVGLAAIELPELALDIGAINRLLTRLNDIPILGDLFNLFSSGRLHNKKKELQDEVSSKAIGAVRSYLSDFTRRIESEMPSKQRDFLSMLDEQMSLLGGRSGCQLRAEDFEGLLSGLNEQALTSFFYAVPKSTMARLGWPKHSPRQSQGIAAND